MVLMKRKTERETKLRVSFVRTVRGVQEKRRKLPMS